MCNTAGHWHKAAAGLPGPASGGQQGRGRALGQRHQGGGGHLHVCRPRHQHSHPVLDPLASGNTPRVPSQVRKAVEVNIATLYSRCQEELDAIFQGDQDRPATSEDLAAMKFIECCLKESIRSSDLI